MAAITLKNVGKTYPGGIAAVQAVNTGIDDGSFTVIVGPSGCGKSTLLRLIAGLETITEGEVWIGDTVVNQLEPAQRDVAMVFQNYALYPHMTVFDNMAYALKIRGHDKVEIKKRVEETAEMLELKPLLDRKPRQLSGGQRQRVAMGRSMVRKPKVFLFDEPLSNLDAKLRTQMRIELKKRHQLLKTTSVYVTHDQVEAMTLGDRLIVMNQGRAEQIGSPMAIYEKPASRFVAGFIGSPAMNFLQITPGADGGEAVLAGGEKIPLPEGRVAGKKQILGIRPEDLTVHAPETPGIPCRVDLVENLGADTLVHGQIAGETNPLTLRLDNAPAPQPGETISLTAPPSRLHFFDIDSGRRLPPG